MKYYCLSGNPAGLSRSACWGSGGGPHGVDRLDVGIDGTVSLWRLIVLDEVHLRRILDDNGRVYVFDYRNPAHPRVVSAHRKAGYIGVLRGSVRIHSGRTALRRLDRRLREFSGAVPSGQPVVRPRARERHPPAPAGARIDGQDARSLDSLSPSPRHVRHGLLRHDDAGVGEGCLRSVARGRRVGGGRCSPSQAEAAGTARWPDAFKARRGHWNAFRNLRESRTTQASLTKPRKFSALHSQRVVRRRLRMSQAKRRSTSQRRR